MNTVSALKKLGERFTRLWPRLAALYVIVSALIGAVLAPAVSLAMQMAVGLSGDAALSDQDILFFLFTPAGFLALLLVGSLFSILLFLQHAALLTMIWSALSGHMLSSAAVLRYLLRRFGRLFRLAVLLLLRIALNLAPFALLLLLIWLGLLSKYDINYYLHEKPLEWFLAVGLAISLLLAAGARVLYLAAGWILCLPLLLLEGASPRQSLRRSRELTQGHKRRIAAWVLGWLIVSTLLTGLTTALLTIGGEFFFNRAHSIESLLAVTGLFALAGLLLSLLTSFFSAAAMSLLVAGFFEQRRNGSRENLPELSSESTASRMPLNYAALGAFIAAGALVAVLLVTNLPKELEFTDKSAIMAHRGASAAAPENTLAAIRAAIDSGAQWVEIDVQETADGEIVVIHDSDLKKLAGSPLTVAGSTLAELRQTDIGSWFGIEFASERIPTLHEVLELCRDRIGINIELKYYGAERQLEQSVVDIVEAADMTDQIIVMSLNYQGIKAMRALRPAWTLGLLSTVAVGNLADLDVDFLALNGRAASRSLLKQARRRGKQVMVWTVNDPLGMMTMMGRGVDVIITDEPALGVALLEQRLQLEPVERLLLQLADLFDRPGLYHPQ